MAQVPGIIHDFTIMKANADTSYMAMNMGETIQKMSRNKAIGGAKALVPSYVWTVSPLSAPMALVQFGPYH